MERATENETKRPSNTGGNVEPHDTGLMIKALSDKNRRAIIGLLYSNGPMFHRDLAVRLGMKSNEVSYHLNVLSKAGYIDKADSAIRIGKSFSRYTLTDRGIRFLDFIGEKRTLDQAIMPPQPRLDYQEGPFTILESYISPWALPKEKVIGWVRWQPGITIQSINLTASEHFVFTKLLDVREQIINPTSSIEIKPSQLEVSGFVGFVGKYDWVPDTELDVEVKVRFVGVESAETVLKLRVIRPVLEVIKFSPKRIRIGPGNRPIKELKIIIQNKGQAEAIDFKTDLTASLSGSGPVAIIKQSISALDRSPNPLVTLSDYPAKLKIRRQGTTKLQLVFRFKDRLWNEYSLTSAPVYITIERVVQEEIPISNIIRGDQYDMALTPLLTTPRRRK